MIYITIDFDGRTANAYSSEKDAHTDRMDYIEKFMGSRLATAVLIRRAKDLVREHKILTGY